jgi:hypothetical protein
MHGQPTVHQLIEIYHNICLSLENHEVICTVFCDISKAFDQVWHHMKYCLSWHKTPINQSISKQSEYRQ